MCVSQSSNEVILESKGGSLIPPLGWQWDEKNPVSEGDIRGATKSTVVWETTGGCCSTVPENWKINNFRVGLACSKIQLLDSLALLWPHWVTRFSCEVMDGTKCCLVITVHAFVPLSGTSELKKKKKKKVRHIFLFKLTLAKELSTRDTTTSTLPQTATLTATSHWVLMQRCAVLVGSGPDHCEVYEKREETSKLYGLG